MTGLANGPAALPYLPGGDNVPLAHVHGGAERLVHSVPSAAGVQHEVRDGVLQVQRAVVFALLHARTVQKQQAPVGVMLEQPLDLHLAPLHAERQR